MKQDKSDNHFKAWPFISEHRRDDGEINNGAFDLISSPEKIDLIHEATKENGLRDLFIYLNGPKSEFMTLGCASGLDGGAYYGYFEFTIRHRELATQLDWPQQFEQKWLEFLRRYDNQYPGIANWLAESCLMEWRYFHLRHETEPRLLVAMYPAAQTEKDFQSLISHIHYFLQELDLGNLN